MLFHHEPVYKNMSIAILERISRLWLKPAAERDIARGHVEELTIRPPDVDTLLGACRAATSRRSRWPSG